MEIIMKLFEKLLAMLLVLVILTASFVACGPDAGQNTPDVSLNDTQGQTPTENPNDGTTDTPETEAPVNAEPLVLAKDGDAFCTVVRYDGFDAASSYVSVASGVKAFLDKIIGERVKLTTDFDRSIHDPDKVEVLVGYTTYDETAAVLSKLSYGEYAVAVEGNKLVIASYCTKGMEKAYSKLMDIVYKLDYTGGNLAIPGDTFVTGVANEQLEALPVYEGGRFYSDYPCGNGADEIIIKDTNITEYNAYLKDLEKAGFTEYTSTTMAENAFATYTNSNYTVNVGYYDYESSTRIVIEKLAPAVGLESDNKYTAVTTSAISMLGCDYINASGEYQSTGLSLAIRLTDGSFVIVDGGHKREDEANALLKVLREMSKDYRGNDKIRISAWIVTHPHGDHCGMLLGYYSKFISECKIERFIGNFIDEDQRVAGATIYPKNIDPNEGNIGNNVSNIASKSGATMHYVRTGQVFYLADLKIETLYTIDSYGPKSLNAINTTSLVMKMTFSDGTVFMMTGDATGHAMQICNRMFGDYLKSDILQVSHHGFSTWGNDTGTSNAYKKMLPATLLWPTGEPHFNKSKTYGYNKVLFSPSSEVVGANPNFKEVYVAGNINQITTTPIPYSVGTTYTWTVN